MKLLRVHVRWARTQRARATEKRSAERESGSATSPHPQASQPVVTDAIIPAAATAQRRMSELSEPVVQRRPGRAQLVSATGSLPNAARPGAIPENSRSANAAARQPAVREPGARELPMSDSAPSAVTLSAGTAMSGELRPLSEQAGQGGRERSERARPVGVVGEPLVVRRTTGGQAIPAGRGRADALKKAHGDASLSPPGNAPPSTTHAARGETTILHGSASETGEPAAEDRAAGRQRVDTVGRPAVAAAPDPGAIAAVAGTPEHLRRSRAAGAEQAGYPEMGPEEPAASHSASLIAAEERTGAETTMGQNVPHGGAPQVAPTDVAGSVPPSAAASMQRLVSNPPPVRVTRGETQALEGSPATASVQRRAGRRGEQVVQVPVRDPFSLPGPHPSRAVRA